MQYRIDWKPEVLKYLEVAESDVDRAKALFGNQAMSKEHKKGDPLEAYPVDIAIEDGAKLAGIDIPCLLRKENAHNAGIIMIVGEAARRNNQTPSGSICTLGTPYAIQYAKAPTRCNVYKTIFKSLTEQYDVYLTDAIKLWTDVKQRHRRLLNADCLDLKMLQEEIECVKPCKIVTFGRVARTAVRSLLSGDTSYDGIEICHLYHPSAVAIGPWKRKILEIKCSKQIPAKAVEMINRGCDMFQTI